MMLHGIALRVDAALKKRGVPFPVVYGPERQDSTVASSSRIVIERDRKNRDVVGPARAVHTNPNMRSVRTVACVARVFAKSNRAGAGHQDHEGVCDVLVDLLDCALDEVIRSDQTLWQATGGKLLGADELAAQGLKTWPGVVYEYWFTIDRGACDRTFAGEAAPEASVGDGGVVLQSTTKVKVNGVGDPETACGG